MVQSPGCERVPVAAAAGRRVRRLRPLRVRAGDCPSSALGVAWRRPLQLPTPGTHCRLARPSLHPLSSSRYPFLLVDKVIEYGEGKQPRRHAWCRSDPMHAPSARIEENSGPMGGPGAIPHPHSLASPLLIPSVPRRLPEPRVPRLQYRGSSRWA